jgi:redox-sensitive bicupin YhaK (pirin superfamily)
LNRNSTQLKIVTLKYLMVGIRMSYADGDVQWMRAGRGVIHEEMWDLRESDWAHKKIEIFQLWVNLPSKKKSLPPSLHVLKNNDIPNIDCGNGVSVKVICGSLVDAESTVKNTDSLPGQGSVSLPDSVTDGPGSVISESPVSILHLSMQLPSSSTIINTEAGCTTIVYVRRGSMILEDGEKVEIRPGDCVIFRPPDSSSARSSTSPNSISRTSSGSSSSSSSSSSNSALQSVTLTAGVAGLDALVLTGKPLNERVIFQGPLVLADEDSFRRSAEGFNR